MGDSRIMNVINKLMQYYYCWKMDYIPEELNIENIKSVVIYCPGTVGGAMALYPVLRALERTKIDQIILVVSPNNAAVFESFQPPHIHIMRHGIPHCITHDNVTVRQAALGIRKTYGTPDLLIDGTRHHNIGNAVFVGTLKARSNLILNSSCSMHCYVPLGNYPQRLGYNHLPIPLMWKQLMIDAGFSCGDGHFEFPVSSKVKQETAEATRELGNYIVLNLDGSQPERQLSASKGIEIAGWLHDKFQQKIIMVYSPQGEVNARTLVKTLDFVHCLPLAPTLQRTASIVEGASLVVTPDTSVLHMASAYNVPVISIHVRFNHCWRPLSSRQAIIKVEDYIDNIHREAFYIAMEEIQHESSLNPSLPVAQDMMVLSY